VSDFKTQFDTEYSKTMTELMDELAIARMLIRELGDRLAKLENTKQEPPKYSFKAHWEKDGRIGVVSVVERPDGGFHVLEDIIDAPKEKNT
jgi:hypothetical protein